MGIARGWEKRVIRTNITYAKRTVRIFSVSPQSRSLFSASFDCSRVLEYAKIRTVLQSRGGTSATQRQKFHTDDANQCLHNRSGSHGVPNINLSNFTCLLVDFGKVLCSSTNKLQQNSNASSWEDYIPQILTVFFRDSSRLYSTFVAFCLLSVIRKQ